MSITENLWIAKNFGYKDFIPMFRAEHFCPAEWMELFQAAGAGYVFPVAEHHDGFQMYRSDLSDWNAVDMGPKRDVLGELKEEAKSGESFLYIFPPCGTLVFPRKWKNV